MSVALSQLKAAVAQAFGVTVAEIEGERRFARVARARQVVMALAPRVTVFVWNAAIGAALGVHRTTVIHARRTIDRLRMSDRGFARRVAAIEAHLLTGSPPPEPLASRRVSYFQAHCDVHLLASGKPIGRDEAADAQRAAAVRGSDALLARLRQHHPRAP